MKKIVVSGLSIACLAAISWQALSIPASDTSAYRFDTVKRADIVVSVTSVGTVQPVANIQVASQISGVFSWISDFNASVKKDQVIGRIAPQTYENALAAAKAEVAMQTALVEKAEIDLNEADTALARKKRLIQTGVGSTVDLETAETGRARFAVLLLIAKRSLEKSKVQLAQAETDLDRTFIRSPVDGVVVSRIEEGTVVAASLQAPLLFVIAPDLRNMQLMVAVDEAEIGKINPGQQVRFRVDAHPERVFAGAVKQIRQYPQSSNGVVTYTVVVSAPNPEGFLLPGMTATATFILAERKNVLSVPTAALMFRAVAGRPAIWTTESQPTDVKIGLSDGKRTEIEGPISENMPVIIGQMPKPKPQSFAKRLIGIY